MVYTLDGTPNVEVTPKQTGYFLKSNSDNNATFQRIETTDIDAGIIKTAQIADGSCYQ